MITILIRNSQERIGKKNIIQVVQIKHTVKCRLKPKIIKNYIQHEGNK